MQIGAESTQVPAVASLGTGDSTYGLADDVLISLEKLRKNR